MTFRSDPTAPAIVQQIVSPQAQYKQALVEQRKDAVVIKRVFGQSPEVLATIGDYFGGDPTGLTVTAQAVVGAGGLRRGEAGAAVSQLRAEKALGTEIKAEVLEDWLVYLKKVAELRGLGHTLVQWEQDATIGFIDHETNTSFQIHLDDVRESRRETRVLPSLLDEYAALAGPLGLPDGEAVLQASRNNRTRAEILGSSEFNSFAPAVSYAEDTEDGVKVTLEDRLTLEALWSEPDEKDTFAAEVPDIGGQERGDPVVDERI